MLSVELTENIILHNREKREELKLKILILELNSVSSTHSKDKLSHYITPLFPFYKVAPVPPLILAFLTPNRFPIAIPFRACSTIIGCNPFNPYSISSCHYRFHSRIHVCVGKKKCGKWNVPPLFLSLCVHTIRPYLSHTSYAICLFYSVWIFLPSLSSSPPNK